MLSTHPAPAPKGSPELTLPDLSYPVLLALAFLRNLLLEPVRIVVGVLRRPLLVIFLVEALVEGSLVARLWSQATNRPLHGFADNAIDLSSVLVRPFHAFDGSSVLHATPYIQFSTLVAIEAYLVAGLVLVVLYVTGHTGWLLASWLRHRPVVRLRPSGAIVPPPGVMLQTTSWAVEVLPFESPSAAAEPIAADAAG